MVATTTPQLNERELTTYVSRVRERWPLDAALLGGARVEDARGAGPQRERGLEYVVVLVSDAFGATPWLERVFQASSLWNAAEMGAPAEVHCYTPAEFERKRESLATVRLTQDRGIDLQAPLAPQLAVEPTAAAPEDQPLTAI